MITYKEALEKVLKNSIKSKKVKVHILDSLNFVLAMDIIAKDDIPVNDNSSMDGFAVISGNLKGASKENPISLRLYDYDIFAGQFNKITIENGRCIKIMTGAPIPSGCDCVVKKEDVEIKGDAVFFVKEHSYFENIRRKGEDIKAGRVVFKTGTIISPAAVGVMASLGIKEVLIYKPPIIGIISTGSELVDKDMELSFGKVRDSNSYSLASQINEANAQFIRYGIIRDDKDKLKEAIKKAAYECDLVLISGGVSVGDYDYIKEILNKSGAKEIFWGVKQKPGKPLAFYEFNEKPIFGLPGNPVSVMVCFELYVRPLIRKLMGYKNLFRNEVSARAMHSFRHDPGRAEFVRVKLAKDKEGNYTVDVTGEQGSGILTSMAEADGIAIIDENKKEIREGEILRVFIIKDYL